MARGRLAGSDKYLTKPFTKDDLLTAIYTHVKLPNDVKAAEANVPPAVKPSPIEEAAPFIDLIDD